jgi:hypothetical protein
MVKWGEAKALVSGITSIQGTSPGSPCIRTLVRNVENQNELGTSASYVRTFILDIGSFVGTVNWNETKALVVHIAEGLPTDARSRAEFDVLKQKGLLRSGTAIIHGTALGDAEFEEMGRWAPADLVAPEQPRALAKQPTSVPRCHGIQVSIDVDGPSGSDDVFGELRRRVQRGGFRGRDQTSVWIRISDPPARALALDKYIGRLAPGLKADITVLRARGTTRTAACCQPPAGRGLVWVGGNSSILPNRWCASSCTRCRR